MKEPLAAADALVRVLGAFVARPKVSVASLRAAAFAVCMCLCTLFFRRYTELLTPVYRGLWERERELWAGAMKPDANLH